MPGYRLSEGVLVVFVGAALLIPGCSSESRSGVEDSDPPALDRTGGLTDTAEELGGVGRSVMEGVYSLEQAESGRVSYEAECGACHLSELEGDGVAPPLKGPVFIERWRGLRLSDLSASIRSTMPQDAPFSLPEETYREIVVYLLAANGTPVGERSLEEADEAAVTLDWVVGPMDP